MSKFQQYFHLLIIIQKTFCQYAYNDYYQHQQPYTKGAYFLQNDDEEYDWPRQRKKFHEKKIYPIEYNISPEFYKPKSIKCKCSCKQCIRKEFQYFEQQHNCCLACCKYCQNTPDYEIDYLPRLFSMEFPDCTQLPIVPLFEFEDSEDGKQTSKHNDIKSKDDEKKTTNETKKIENSEKVKEESKKDQESSKKSTDDKKNTTKESKSAEKGKGDHDKDTKSTKKESDNSEKAKDDAKKDKNGAKDDKNTDEKDKNKNTDSSKKDKDHTQKDNKTTDDRKSNTEDIKKGTSDTTNETTTSKNKSESTVPYPKTKDDKIFLTHVTKKQCLRSNNCLRNKAMKVGRYYYNDLVVRPTLASYLYTKSFNRASRRNYDDIQYYDNVS